MVSSIIKNKYTNVNKGWQPPKKVVAKNIVQRIIEQLEGEFEVKNDGFRQSDNFSSALYAVEQ